MIPRTVFGEEHEMFRSSVRRFLQEEVVPFHDAWEKDGQVDRDLWRKAGAQGYLVPQAPEEYGGAQADFLYNAVIDEEVDEVRDREVLFFGFRECSDPFGFFFLKLERLLAALAS